VFENIQFVMKNVNFLAKNTNFQQKMRIFGEQLAFRHSSFGSETYIDFTAKNFIDVRHTKNSIITSMYLSFWLAFEYEFIQLKLFSNIIWLFQQYKNRALSEFSYRKEVIFYCMK